MTCGDMNKRSPKKSGGNPRLCIRIEPELLAQVNALKAKTDLSQGQIVSRALRKALPLLEKVEAELKAA
jgi:hypothetical protein